MRSLLLLWGPLTDFWRQREEAEFIGVGNIPVRFVRFRTDSNDRTIVICPWPH